MSSPIQSGTYVKTPVPSHSIQFDGTIASLTHLLSVVSADLDGVIINTMFGPGGVITQVTIRAPRIYLSFAPGEWVIAPDSADESLFVLSDEKYQLEWVPDAIE